jgi:hypothetical protein
MIDLTNEEVLTLSKACKLPELRRNGKAPHPTTMLRWVLRGCRGIQLESARSGGRRVTSREAVRRWLDKLNGAAPTPAHTSAGHQRAEAELLLAGI